MIRLFDPGESSQFFAVDKKAEEEEATYKSDLTQLKNKWKSSLEGERIWREGERERERDGEQLSGLCRQDSRRIRTVEQWKVSELKVHLPYFNRSRARYILNEYTVGKGNATALSGMYVKRFIHFLFSSLF